jgi:hypothetical protein
MKKIISLILLLSFLLQTSYIFAEGAPKPVKEKTKWGAEWRSVLFPGWGQIYLGEKKKGEKLVIIEGVLIGSTYATWEMSENAYKKYKEAIYQSDITKYYDEANKYHLYSNYLSIGAIGFWVYSLLNLCFDKDVIKNNKITLIPLIDKDSVRIVYIKLF